MKQLKYIAVGCAAIIVAAGCNQTEFEPIPAEKLPGTKIESTTTIKSVLDTYMTDDDQYTDTAGKKAGLFTADIIRAESQLVINGIVTTSDVEGTAYKYMIVQEEAPDGMAIKLSVDAGGLSAIYPLGTRVSVILNGLAVGKYAQSPQIGIRYENPTRYKEDPTTGKRYHRIEPGRIPFTLAKKQIVAYGMPDVAAIKCDTLTIAQIKAAGPVLFNKLVCIKNAHFTGRGARSGRAVTLPAEELIFAPSTNGVGYPQSREIVDGTGALFISTSEYAKFAHKPLPSSKYKGDITAIVGWYNDKDVALNTSKTYHQLTLRSINDLGRGFEEYHQSVR